MIDPALEGKVQWFHVCFYYMNAGKKEVVKRRFHPWSGAYAMIDCRVKETDRKQLCSLDIMRSKLLESPDWSKCVPQLNVWS